MSLVMDDVKARENEKDGRGRSVSKQVILGLLTNFSSLAPSMSLGFSAIALPILTGHLGLIQMSWFASIASLATPFGCFFAGPVADRLGRKTALFFVNAAAFLGWLTLALACYRGHHFFLLLVGRMITGFSTGLCSSPATIYMAEVASSELRGVFTTWASISFSVGVLLVYFLGFLFKTNLAVICLVTACIPCIGVLLTMFFVPESPSWLVGKNRVDEARTNMHLVLGSKASSERVESEVGTLLKNKGSKKYPNSKSLAQQFLRKLQYMMKLHILRPIALVLTYFLFQQLAGTFVLVFYAIDVVKRAGIKFDPYLTIVILGVVRLLSSILGSYLSKIYGRRPLSLFSGIGMSICLMVLASYLHMVENGKVVATPVVPLMSFVIYFVTNAIGFLPLPFALAAELFPTKIRGTAAGFISGMGYLFSFVAIKIYPDLVAYYGIKGIFYCYGTTAVVGTLFVLILLPETKGKSLAQLEAYFGKPDVSTSEQESERIKA